MKLSLVLTFLCLCVAGVHGSLSCFIGCLMPVIPDRCQCDQQVDLLSDLITRQEHHNHHHNHHTLTPEPETTPIPIRLLKTTTIEPKLLTTTDICDTLCKIQLGGDACHCSKPGLPGRK